MNTYVDSTVLPIGYEMLIDDPNSGEQVKARVVASGWQQRGGNSGNNRYEMFDAEVVEGFESGRMIRGYTDTFDNGSDEDESICAFILTEPGLDEVARDLRLAREEKISDRLPENRSLTATLEHIMTLRGQLEARGWDVVYLREYLKPEDAHLDLRYFKSCGSANHRGTGWLNGMAEVVHDGQLVGGPTTTWDNGTCGCSTSHVEGHSVVRLEGYPQVYATERATIEQVESFLRAAHKASHAEFQQNHPIAT